MKNNKKERKDFFKSINDSEHIKNLIAHGLMVRTYQMMDIELTSDNDRLQDLINNYQAALLMNVVLLEQIGHGTEKLKDVNDERWNTLNDIQILFGLLYSRNGNEEKKLVTEERKIKEVCDDSNIGFKILTVNQYETLLGLWKLQI
jgi:hypothetical protein